MPYTNNYEDRRKQLPDDTKYLPEKSPLGLVLGGILGITAIAIGGVAAYKSGKLKPVMNQMIQSLSNFTGTYPDAVSRATRAWAEDNAEEISKSMLRTPFLQTIKNLSNNRVRNEMFEHTVRDVQNFKDNIANAIKRTSEIKQKIMPSIEELGEGMAPELYRDIDNMRAILKEIQERATGREGELEMKAANKFRDLMYEELIKNYTVTAEQQAELARQTGYRFLTIGDLFDVRGNVIDEQRLRQVMSREFYDDFVQFVQTELTSVTRGPAFRNLRFDRNILIQDTKGVLGDIANLKPFYNSISDFVNSLANDFQIPFVGINPIKLFNFNAPFKDKPPIFEILKKGSIQPVITGSAKPLDFDMFFINGRVYGGIIDENGKIVYDFVNPIATNMVLKSTRAGLNTEARYLKEMAGLSMRTVKEPGMEEPLRRAWYKIAEILDVGFQDKPTEPFELTKPFSYLSIIDKFLKGAGRPGDDAMNEVGKALRDVFKSDFVVMNKSVRLFDVFKGQSENTVFDYFKQYFVSRDSIKNLTGRGLIPYAFMERLNSGIGSVGLGLSQKSTKSAFDIYKNLMLKRLLPIVGAITLWNYINYESEKIFGFEPEDELADAYVNARIGFASVRDMLGITDVAKRIRLLTPGSEQISDIPFIPFGDIDKTAEELEQYYLYGEDPIRKGRYWTLGNAPYTGMKVQYYRPNWYRRVKSDWQYTESLYGSKDEYWQNYWLPTPRYPLAPVRHFITDNRHWEEKHYKDRPYLISEGINELEGIPIFGPLIDDTIGRILKPPKKMHPEYWEAYERGELLPGQLYGVQREPGETPISEERRSDAAKIRDSKSKQKVVEPANYSSDIIYVEQEKNNDDSTTLTYITSSGQIQVVTAPGRVHTNEINKAIKASSLAKSIRGVQKKYLTPEGQDLIVRGSMPPYDPTFAEVMIDISEMGGIYGFALTDLLGIYEPDQVEEMATPSDISSLRDSFWELEIGGLGGNLSEIGRRFIPRDKNKQDEFNPIRNTMPTWIPGDDYFLNLQRGDPYRIPYGEIRLPGEAFEKIEGLGNVMDLPARGSMMGYSKDEMISFFFNDKAVMSDYVREATEEGDKLHRRLQEQWAKEGTLIDAEVTIYNEEDNYTGHYDARVVDETSPTREALVDIKTLSQKRWDQMIEQGAPYEHHSGQINAYLHTTGIPKGYIYYINRDNPDAEPVVFELWYDPEKYQRQRETLEAARQEARALIESGARSRGDLYDYFTRFKILADVAPYSKEFKEYKALLSQVQLTDEQKEELKVILEQVKEQKKKTRMYDYRFATANLKGETVTISKVLNNSMFLTEEYPEHPIKFAGISVSSSKTSKEGKAATEFLSNYIREGMKVRIYYDLDEAKRINNDTYRTISAVVSSRGIKNLNKRLIEEGLAKEKEEDWSPAGVRARFTPAEIRLGAMWERIAHMDTFVNTKFLQVRSPLEQYERRQVYGKDFQSWSRPIKDYIVPGVEKLGGRGFVGALIAGTVIGSLFGKTKYGKLIGAVMGATTAITMQFVARASEAWTGERWVPQRRRKEWEINEYIDMLKYIRSRKYFEEYAKLSLDKEQFDVKAYIAKKKAEGEERQRRIKELENIKRLLRFENITAEEAVKRAGIETDSTDSKEILRQINAEIKQLSQFREVQKLPPLAARALQYYLQSERTLYGFDPGDSIQNAIAALPTKEREYFMAFLEAPEEERDKILRTVPRYMRRMLQSSWGLKVDEKPDLVEYFTTYQLPSPAWEGWSETVDLNIVKTKIVQHTNLDPTELNIWPDDEKIAENYPVRAPRMNVRDNAYKVKRRLEELMLGSGFEDIRIDIEPANHDYLDISMDIRNDKRREIEQWMNEYGYTLLE